MMNYKQALKEYHNFISYNANSYSVLYEGRKIDFDQVCDDGRNFLDTQFLKANDKYFARIILNEITGVTHLDFCLSDQLYSQSFLSFVLDFLTSEDQHLFRKTQNIYICDYREVFNFISITMDNAIIDDKLITFINRFFPNLKCIKFQNCRIMESCNLSLLFKDSHNIDYSIDDMDMPHLALYNSVIENINSLNYYNFELDITYPVIKKITNSMINAKKIKINKLSDDVLANIFFLCHFNKLEELIIGQGYGFTIDSSAIYDKFLKVIPYAAPNLKELTIEGCVDNFDFLYHFHHLNTCEINSFNDSIGYYQIINPYISNDANRNKILAGNEKLNSDFDVRVFLHQKLEKIVRALGTISYSEEDKNLYLHKKTDIILNLEDYLKMKQVFYYYIYEVANKKLTLSKCCDDSIVFMGQYFEIKKPIKKRYLTWRTLIPTAKPFVYHSSEKPILFDYETASYEDTVKEGIKNRDVFDLEVEDENILERKK